MGPGGDGAAFAPAAAEVDRDQGQASGTGAGFGGGRQRPSKSRQRPAVSGNKGVVTAGIGQVGSAGDSLRDGAGEAAAGVDFTSRRDSRDGDQQQQSDQRDYSRLLDARRSPL